MTGASHDGVHIRGSPHGRWTWSPPIRQEGAATAGAGGVTDEALLERVSWPDEHIDYTGCRSPVASLLGVGHAATYLFDFGDEWYSLIRYNVP